METATLLAKAFDLVAEKGWCQFSLADLADAEELRPLDIYRQVGSKSGLLCLLGRHLDQHMLDFRTGEVAAANPKEVIFELLMRRFDAMGPMKAGLAGLVPAARSNPGLLVASMCNLKRMAHWIVGVADPKLGGVHRMLAEKAVVVLYLRCFAVWLKDATEDNAKTMAELDKGLGQLERLARWTRAGLSRQSPKAA